MKCLVCGETCRWLYYPKSDYGWNHSEDSMVETNLWYCPKCEHVYRQWIESKVHRDKVDPIIVGEEQ